MTMTVYVDALTDWGWVLHGEHVASCHMFTDAVDLEELHRMAEAIGMRRAWFQNHRTAPHYDLVASGRAAALALGARAIGRRQSVAVWRARREAVATGRQG